MRAKLNPETRKKRVGAKHAQAFLSRRNRERSFRGHHSFGHVREMSLSSRVPVGRSLAASRRPAPRASVRCVADAVTAVSTETLKRKILRLSALTDRGQLLFQQKACVSLRFVSPSSSFAPRGPRFLTGSPSSTFFARQQVRPAGRLRPETPPGDRRGGRGPGRDAERERRRRVSRPTRREREPHQRRLGVRAGDETAVPILPFLHGDPGRVRGGDVRRAQVLGGVFPPARVAG